MKTLRPGLILLAAALIAACDSAGPSSVATNIAATPTPAAASASAPASRAPSGSPTPSVKPPVTSAPSPASSRPPTAAPTTTTAAPTTAAVTAAPAVPVDGCTGSAANRTFLASASSKVAWALYCAALPSGWYVNAGNYTQANGGTMVITYKTNAGATLELKEGAWCQGIPIECGPYDAAIGDASFGDMAGQLGKKGSAFVLYVKPGQNPAWAAIGTGVDEATFRSVTRALLKVAK